MTGTSSGWDAIDPRVCLAGFMVLLPGLKMAGALDFSLDLPPVSKVEDPSAPLDFGRLSLPEVDDRGAPPDFSGTLALGAEDIELSGGSGALPLPSMGDPTLPGRNSPTMEKSPRGFSSML